VTGTVGGAPIEGKNRRVEHPIGRACDGGTDVARGVTRERRLDRATRAARATPREPFGARDGGRDTAIIAQQPSGGQETVVAAGGKSTARRARARSEHALLFTAAERHLCERYEVRSPTAGRVRRLVAHTAIEPRLTHVQEDDDEAGGSL